MKRTNHLGLRVVVLTILFFLSMAAVSAQSLDGKWFVLKCQATTFRVDPATGNFVHYDFGFKAYVHFTYITAIAPRGSVYHCDVWTQQSPGNWVISTSADRSTPSFSENFTTDFHVTFYTKDGVSVSTFITPHFSVMPNIFSAGGEIYSGSDDYGNALFGWLLIKGELTTALPFSPV